MLYILTGTVYICEGYGLLGIKFTLCYLTEVSQFALLCCVLVM